MSDHELDLPYLAVIPYNIQIDDTITDTCKLYYGQIVGLGKKSGYMWATDDQLAKMKGVSVRTIERWHTQLEHSGHIRRETNNVPSKDSEGNLKWTKRRKIFFTDGFQPKDNSKNVCEPDKDVGSYEPDKIGGSNEPDKIGGIIKTSLEESLKEQCEAAAPVVVSSFYELEIQEKLRTKILKEYSAEEIDLAVQRCLNWKGRPSDEVGIMTTLKRAALWDDNPTVEDIIEKNSKYLKSLINLDGTSIANTRITVGNKYIEFVSGMKVTTFGSDEKDFKKSVVDYIEHLKRLEDSRI